MNIKTKAIIIIIVFSIIAVLLAIYMIVLNVRSNNAMKEITLAENLVEGVFQLNLLTNDYLSEESERAVEQWRLKYTNLWNEIDVEVHASNRKDIFTSIKKRLKNLGQIFDEVVKSKPNSYRRNTLEMNLRLESIDLVTSSLELSALSKNEVNTSIKTTLILSFTIIAVLIILILVMYFVLMKTVLKPLGIIKHDMSVISEGDLDHTINIEKRDEIGDLAQKFNLMTSSLKTTLTSKKELETEIELRREAEGRTEQLMKELKSSNEELEQFAYIASHDLQEPLRKIKNFSELILKLNESNFDMKTLKYFDYVIDGAGRMQRFIQDLLKYSRVTTRGGEFEEESLKKVIDAAVENLQIAIKENNAEIIYGDLPYVMIDSRQMVQLFQNLIGNAIKFHNAEAPKITINAKEEDDHWLISVKDNGIGIHKEEIDKIFVIFQRGAARDKYEGTGIGLSVCKKIVERHNGRIWVESEPGKGATFYFTLQKISRMED